MLRMGPCGTVIALTAAALLALGSPASAEDAADIAQIDGTPGGVANVFQQGTGNRADIDQRAVAYGGAQSQNHALINQDGKNNDADILQDGSANSAEILQKGSSNQGSIYQQYSGNSFVLQQTGNGMSASIEQFGAGASGAPPITILQSK